MCVKSLSMLNAGVIGAGHLGKIHLKLLNQSDNYHLVGFYDSDPEAVKNISKEFGYKSFKSMEALIEACDMIDVVTPTLYHFDCAKKVLYPNSLEIFFTASGSES